MKKRTANKIVNKFLEVDYNHRTFRRAVATIRRNRSMARMMAAYAKAADTIRCQMAKAK